MEEKKINKGNTGKVILLGTGVLLLLASGFDLLPAQDNLLVFLGLACFIIASVIGRISKDTCCK